MERINKICEDFSSRLQRLRERNHEEQPFYPNGTAREVFRGNRDDLDELFESLLCRPDFPSNNTISKQTLSDLVHRIVRHLSTTLAIVFRIRSAGDINILREFIDLIIHNDTFHEPSRLSDDDLPISLDDARLLFPSLANEFFDTQFQFCAVTLRREGGVVYQDYRSQCPLPYKWQEKIGGGAFGKVYKVKIKRGHLRSTDDRTGNLQPEWLARKDFGREQYFTLEVDTLKSIMGRPEGHDHLVMVVAILQYHDTNSLFFPLATCDLQQYFDGECCGEQPAPTTLEEKSTIFNRGVALAGALAFLHEGFSGVTFLHLDLKPSNVLVYNAYDHQKEIWKITDFGLTRLRNPEYSSVAPDIEGTYLPPECAKHDGRVATRSDVWSLGCIFSLVLTYMIYGSRGVRKFREKRGQRPEGDIFYVTTRNSTARISPAVTSWFDHLKQSTRSNERESRVIRESLEYLQRKVLHPVLRERASAKDVETALKRIHLNFEQQMPPPSPPPRQDQSEHISTLERLLTRLLARLKHRTSESSVSRLQSFRYDLGTNGFGFRFSPLDGDYLAFFSSKRILVWTVSEIVSALENGSPIQPPHPLDIADGAIKSFAVSAKSICTCPDRGSFQCYISTIQGPSSFARIDDDVKVSYDHMGYIKRVVMSLDGALAAFVITDRPRGSELDCKVYLAYTQHLIDTAHEGNSYSLPRSSRSNSVSESSLMSVTTAANLILEKVLVGSAAQIRFLDFTPDGKFLVIIIQDGSRGFFIRAWETYSGKCYRDLPVAIESGGTLRSLFTTCCLFVSRWGDPCLAVVSDRRRIIHVNLAKGTHEDQKLDVDVERMFVCEDGKTLVLIGKNHGLRAYLLPLDALDRYKFIGIAKINRLSYVPALDAVAVRRDTNGQLKLLIASSSGSFLDMGIEY